MDIKDLSGLGAYAPILHEFYKDMAQPAAKNMGLALGAITSFGLFLHLVSSWGTNRLNMCLKNNLEQYAERIKKIPPENITEAPPEVAIPIIEKLSYVTNEELTKLYIELLAKASIKDLNTQAHPSFVNIINNLSPDEATLLNKLESEDRSKFICLQIKLSDSKKQTSRRISSYYSEFEQNSILTFEQNAPAYISNLIGLGIFQVSEQPLKQEKKYMRLAESVNAQWQEIMNGLDEEELKYSKEFRSLQFKKGHILLTEFGHLFINAVNPPHIDMNEEPI